MNRLWILAFGLTGAAALALWAVLRAPPPRPAANAELERELAELRGRVAELQQAPPPESRPENLRLLEQKVSELERRQLPEVTALPVPAPASSFEQGSAVPERPPIAETPEQDRARSLRRMEEVGKKLDAAMEAEPVDAAWRSETLAALQQTFAPLTNAKLLGADCGSSLCRVLIENASPESQREFPGDIAGHAPFDQDVIYRYDFESQPPKTTLYVARAGTSLSRLTRNDADSRETGTSADP